MFRLIYNLFMPVGFLFYVPGLYLKYRHRPGWKNTFMERFGCFSPERVKELARSNEIMEKQYDAGLSSVMDLLDVRRQLLAARQEQAEARRRQLAAVVGLCKALGGGWTEAKGFE